MFSIWNLIIILWGVFQLVYCHKQAVTEYDGWDYVSFMVISFVLVGFIHFCLYMGGFYSGLG